MSRNIKEIGKELLGKSLNSYHRRTGLTQLEENNKMQDGILDGILSQVDDAYIDKTEQSNVIHLDGSGDGVVVVDSIEGNTMVNMVKSYNTNDFVYSNAIMQSDGYFKIQYGRDVNASYVRPKLGIHTYKPNTQYTVIVDIKENTCGKKLGMSAIHSAIQTLSPRDFQNTLGISTSLITTRSDINIDDKGNPTIYDLYFGIWEEDGGDLSKHITFRYWILEGDWRNKELPPYFTGLQSSFEEKVNDEGKYEIEILCNNKNIYIPNTDKTMTYGIDTVTNGVYKTNSLNTYNTFGLCNNINNINTKLYNGVTKIKKGETYTHSCKIRKISGEGKLNYFRMFGFNRSDNKYLQTGLQEYSSGIELDSEWKEMSFTNIAAIDADLVVPCFQVNSSATNCIIEVKDIQLQIGEKSNYDLQKSNKIKLLLDEPLRAIENTKDRLCIKNGKLLVERKCAEVLLDGTQELHAWNSNKTNTNYTSILLPNGVLSNNIKCICDRFKNETYESNKDYEYCYTWVMNGNSFLYIHFEKSKGSSYTEFKQWLSKNNTKVVYKLEQPIYEEVLNEYGEPILLEGYENGTLYIDSAIVPTTTVRYTPKMESFKTLNEVSNNNTMLANDINDNIIPYMMDVDFMIMEKEMALMSHKNIRKMEVLDMTSMQKRTQDMLERLIKGKTLTEQECKTRITTYLNAGKITDAQAEELMLLIDEVYA